MPIRWNALKVKEATDMMEELVNQAAEPLEQIRTVARAAHAIDNLPQYVDQHFARIIDEINRAIGGGYWEPEGRLRSTIETIRKDLPEGSVEREQERLRTGITAPLM